MQSLCNWRNPIQYSTGSQDPTPRFPQSHNSNSTWQWNTAIRHVLGGRRQGIWNTQVYRCGCLSGVHPVPPPGYYPYGSDQPLTKLYWATHFNCVVDYHHVTERRTRHIKKLMIPKNKNYIMLARTHARTHAHTHTHTHTQVLFHFHERWYTRQKVAPLVYFYQRLNSQ